MNRTSLKSFVAVALLTASALSFAGNLTVSREVTVNANPETTWKMIGDFNHLDVWHPVVVNSELKQGSSNAAHAVRLLTLGNGATITETQLSHDDVKHTYTYAITESPLPVSDYESTLSVTPAADGKSLVTWSSSFDAKGVSDDEAVNAIAGIYDAGFANLDKHFNK